jgi:hypothetical protein
MKKFIAGACLLTGLLNVARAQQSVQVLSHTVSDVELTYPDEASQKFYLKSSNKPLVKLSNIQTKVIDVLPAGATYASSFEPEIRQFTERKKPVLFVNVPVYRKAGGKIEQLLSYDTQVTETPSDPNTQPAHRPTGVTNSVLANGTWYKIGAPNRGIYKITYSFLQSIGVNVAAIDPANIRVYGNGGTVLPEKVTSDAPDDLTENAIFVSSTGSTFGVNDYILFYANGPTLWTNDTAGQSFFHTSNYYEDQSYYFLNFDLGSGKRITSENATGAADDIVAASDDYLLIENDSANLGNIGKTWWGNRMNSINPASLTQTFALNLGTVSGQIKVTSPVASVSDQGATIVVKTNGTTQQVVSLSASGDVIPAAVGNVSFLFAPPSGNTNLQYTYSTGGTGAGYIDYIQLNYRKLLQFQNGQFSFRDWQTFLRPATHNAGYNIQNANGNLKVWEVSDPLNPVALNGTLNGSVYSIVRPESTLREFIAFDNTFNNPVKLGQSAVPNQNLHALGQTDFLIIAPDTFIDAANDLADFHRQHDNMNVTVVQLDKIYNEFSSGGQDIAGIRNFIKMFYDRSAADGSNMVKNVLFVGAASFDYKNRLSFNTNFVPTFETYESIALDVPYSSDDFYALLADGDNVETINSPNDVATGRIPAYTRTEVEEYVNKVKQYASSASFGPWKNVVSYVADNIDFNDGSTGINHMGDCESVDQFYYNNTPVYNLYKLYCDAYAEVITPSGGRYPMVNKAIDDQIYNGTFLMSYSGHGSPDRWADEAILTPDDYSNWTNPTKLPVMVTATCDFGRFDDPTHRSAGAKLMINPAGGSIAMITTTQVVYNYANTALSLAYITKQFTKNSNNQWWTLGEALAEAKNSASSNSINNHKYVVLGDPALTMAMPIHKVQTVKLESSDNGVLTETDTIKALGRYILSGKVTDDNNNTLTDFNGPVYVSVYDKMKQIQVANPNQTVTPYFNLQTNIVAKVKGTVTNGLFSVEFVAPKDINYNYGSGKISYYANTTTVDASGVDSSFTVGDINRNAPDDNTPPVVKPYIDDDKFRDGGVTGPNPLLYVSIYDLNGINVSGTSIGHDLVGILDGDIQDPYVMNDYYQTVQNDFSNGFVNFPLYNLPEGKHTLKVIAWDTYNNSGEGTVSFEVKNKDKGFISDIYNYPNPVNADGTTFVFEHNQEGEHLDVTIMIYSPNGSLVKTLQQSVDNANNRTEIHWNGHGNNDLKLMQGVYFYKLNAKTSTGISATAYQKLVILR